MGFKYKLNSPIYKDFFSTKKFTIPAIFFHFFTLFGLFLKKFRTKRTSKPFNVRLRGSYIITLIFYLLLFREIRRALNPAKRSIIPAVNNKPVPVTGNLPFSFLSLPVSFGVSLATTVMIL